MTITTSAQLASALRQTSPIMYFKTAVQNGAIGEGITCWPRAGTPPAGAFPVGAPATCNHLTVGAIPTIQQPAGRLGYLAGMKTTQTSGGLTMTMELYDRLIHTQAFDSTITTPQAVNCDLNAFLGVDNIDARKGDANYSDVQWWYEARDLQGGLSSFATVNVTYNDGSTGDLTAFQAAAFGANRSFPLTPFIPVADQGKFIRGINTLTYSASTGQGNPGFAATVFKGSTKTEYTIENTPREIWDMIGLPVIHNNSCLFTRCVVDGTDIGNVSGQIHIVYG